MEILNCLIFATFLLFQFQNAIAANYKLTPEEEKAMNQFRPIAHSIVMQFVTQEGIPYFDPYSRTPNPDPLAYDPYFLKFLQARDLDVQKAAEMVRNTLKWRKDNKMDTIFTENFDEFDEHFKLLQEGEDKEARPVIISPFGTYDVRKFVLAGKLPKLLRWMDRMLELAFAEARRRLGDSGNTTSAVAIIDLGGFSLRKQACTLCLTTIPHMFTTLENHYPGFFHRIFLINTPSVFMPVLEIARPFLSKTTATGLRIFGHNRDEWTKALLKEINPDQLPRQFGGTQVLDSLASDWRRRHPETAAFIGFKSKSKSKLAS